MDGLMMRYWPLEAAYIVTSPFGPRDGGFHAGVDFGYPSGSGGRLVYAIQSGTIIYAGAADGYGGSPGGLAGWLVIDSDDSQGGGCLEYGHIVHALGIKVGTKVAAGQPIAIINPDRGTNGGVAPHLHLSDMPGSYDPNAKQDPMPRLAGALNPTGDAIKGQQVAGRPDFNEYSMWSPNNQDRGGAKVDLFLLHTQEGDGNADQLARFLCNPVNQVSYHYTISVDPRDKGVTVVDVVDTDRASWSVLSANGRSINLCFAGSRASWSRQQWLDNAGRAIDVAAWLAVQDCKKYGIPTTVIAPPYLTGRAGISDHAYVTKVLGDGTHTDVGPSFPWDVFAAAVAKYGGTTTAPPPTPPAKPVPQYPRDYSDRELLEDIWRKLMKLVSK